MLMSCSHRKPWNSVWRLEPPPGQFTLLAMQITLNGEARTLPDGQTVAELVASLDLSDKRVAVEVNKDLVRRAEHPAHTLADGDVVEVVTLVGGG